MVASHAPIACSSSPAAASWLPKRARNARLIGLSRSWNSVIAAGNATARWARSWLQAATRCAHQVPACPYRHPQRDGRGRVGDQRPQPGPVRAQRVGQHERIEPVVLGAGGAEPRPQVLHLPGGDHHHRQAGGQQGIDQRAVAPLDGDLGDLGSGAAG